MTGNYPASVALALVCVACSTVYEGKYARDEGWRPGTILEIEPGAELKHAGWRDCRKGLPAERVAAEQFATVEFFGAHRKSTITVPVQNADSFKPGEQVYVDIRDCEAALQSRGKDARLSE